MAEATRTHSIEELQQIAEHGLPPALPGTQAPAQDGGGLPEGIFGPEDLAAPDLYPAEEFAMPGGKTVWVHATSPEEVAWLTTRAAADLQKRPADGEVEKATRAEHLARIYQAICCCRTGPEPDARRVFGPRHARLLQTNLSWETLRRINALSDRLGGDAGPLEDVVRGFFDAIRRCFVTLSSRLSTDSPDACRAFADACAGIVSRVLSAGGLTAEDLRAMRRAGSGEAT